MQTQKLKKKDKEIRNLLRIKEDQSRRKNIRVETDCGDPSRKLK